MGDGDGERVGDVVGFGCFLKAEEPGDHKLNLLFLGAARAGDGLFDFGRRIFGVREI